jgi:hypothetical protein
MRLTQPNQVAPGGSHNGGGGMHRLVVFYPNVSAQIFSNQDRL